MPSDDTWALFFKILLVIVTLVGLGLIVVILSA